ncbi:MAG: apolipoprotein N-acyltransferase [Oceanospirillaceae bacterium]|nr:apolipoprotein N-acyltransferase [Oceanospirillaceae bacterium]
MWLSALLALISGAITTLAFAPFDIFAIALITPAALYILLNKRSIKQACLLGWLFGLGFFGSGISWVYVSIHTYGNTPAPLAALLTLIFCAALALLFLGQIWLYRKHFYASHKVISFAVLWLVFEWLRSWLLTGFPWLYLGYTSIDTPLAPLASIGGVWLSSAVVIAISLSIAHALEAQTKRAIGLAIAIPTLAIMVSLNTPANWTKSSGEPIDIAIIQPNIPQLTKWNSSYLAGILNKHYQSTEPLLGNKVIIWPETAIPSLYPDVAEYLAPLVKRQAELGGSLISGIPSMVPDIEHPLGRRIHNSIYNLTQDTIYHKQRLVPFGEYVPLQDTFRDLFNFLNIPDLTFSRPKIEQQALLQVGDYQYSTAICYEIAYPELVRQYSKNADLILTLSNDTWFSHSIGPDQHFQIARMRAIENGRWLVRSANNGISAIVNPQGEVVHIAPRYQEAILEGKVVPMQGLTPYQRTGHWPLVTLYFLILAFIGWRNRRVPLTN